MKTVVERAVSLDAHMQGWADVPGHQEEKQLLIGLRLGAESAAGLDVKGEQREVPMGSLDWIHRNPAIKRMSTIGENACGQG